jgi:hypothetical protein
MNMKNLINSILSNLRKYLVLGENLKAKNDYLHFLATTSNHNRLIEIVTSEYCDDEKKWERIIDYLNNCVQQTNELNKKHGGDVHEQDYLDRNFKIRREKGKFHFGLITSFQHQ